MDIARDLGTIAIRPTCQTAINAAASIEIVEIEGLHSPELIRRDDGAILILAPRRCARGVAAGDGDPADDGG